MLTFSKKDIKYESNLNSNTKFKRRKMLTQDIKIELLDEVS
jgi:hypothetical protein